MFTNKYLEFLRSKGLGKDGRLIADALLTLATPWILIPVGVYYRKQLSRYYWSALAWMVLYLIPYWAITYYDRYGAPLIAIKAWLVIMVVAQWRKNLSDQNTVDSNSLNESTP